MVLRIFQSALAVAAATLALSSHAVIIDSGDGTGNTTAPPNDPGWDHVGTRSGRTVVYAGDGWVLTANHVGVGTVVFQGVVYNPIGTGIRLDNGDGTFADLMLFAIDALPPLPVLPIRATTPPIGTPVTLIGNGRDRGPVTSWDANGPPPPPPIGGYEWAATKDVRWGTNHVEGYPDPDPSDTVSFLTRFDTGLPTAHEAQAANGDSGGAAFIDDGGQWELAGLMLTIGIFGGQPADTALYGNETYAADLSFYRDQIEAIVATPEPSAPDGLGWSLLLLAVLGRRRLAAPRVHCRPFHERS